MLGRRMLDPNLARSMLSGELTEGRGQDRVHSRRVVPCSNKIVLGGARQVRAAATRLTDFWIGNNLFVQGLLLT